MFRFASPYFLLLLPILGIIFFYRKRALKPAMASSSVAVVGDIRPSIFLRMSWIVSGFNYSAVIFLIIALARPQMGVNETFLPTEGINIVLALDLSESMAAMDFTAKGKVVDRLTATKNVVNDFVEKRGQDRIGLVVFGSHAYTQLPLTRDYSAIVTILEHLKIGSAGPNTAIGDAIGIAIKRLKDIKSKSNVIILLTDGQSNSGQLSPEDAVKIAREKKIKIYTIGVGRRGLAPFLIEDPVFGKRYVRHRVDMDEKSLKAIAKQTGGAYFKAENTHELEKIYDSIDQLEITAVKVKTFAQYNDFYHWVVIFALILLTAAIILDNTRFLRVP
jgi:Ca-activated chloride channel family protein